MGIVAGITVLLTLLAVNPMVFGEEEKSEPFPIMTVTCIIGTSTSVINALVKRKVIMESMRNRFPESEDALIYEAYKMSVVLIAIGAFTASAVCGYLLEQVFE